jgi:hypothetical protein
MQSPRCRKPAESLERDLLCIVGSLAEVKSRSRDVCELCEALRELTKGANSIGAGAFADVREAETAASL